jgi:hypothetical protein
MIFFQTEEDGVQLLIGARTLALVIRTPPGVERRTVQLVNVSVAVQVNAGWFFDIREQALKIAPSGGDWRVTDGVMLTVRP